MLKIYGDPISGNCYKLKLICELTGQPYDWVHVDVVKGEAKTPSFLELNPNGKVPILELDSGDILAESNACLAYLAEGTSFLPEDKLDRAKVFEWLFFEQYSHEPFIATSRFWIRFLNAEEAYRAQLAEKRPGGYKALDVMEKRLGDSPFLATDNATIADIALYAYTHVADEGGFSLADYPSIRTWIGRVEALPRFVSMMG